MKYKIAFVFLAILSINFVSIIAYEYDEYYCRNHPYYQICHRCKDVDETCDRQEQGCHCDNIAIFHDGKRKLWYFVSKIVLTYCKKKLFKGGFSSESAMCFLNLQKKNIPKKLS